MQYNAQDSNSFKGEPKRKTILQAPSNSKREPLVTTGLAKRRGFQVQRSEKMRGLVGSNSQINKREDERKVTHQFANHIPEQRDVKVLGTEEG